MQRGLQAGPAQHLLAGRDVGGKGYPDTDRDDAQIYQYVHVVSTPLLPWTPYSPIKPLFCTHTGQAALRPRTPASRLLFTGIPCCKQKWSCPALQTLEIFLLRHQIPRALHPVDEDRPLDMVEFVLEHPRQEVRILLLPQLPGAGQVAHADPPVPGDQAAQAGDAETALPARLLLVRHPEDLRVDHRSRLHLRGLGIARIG